MKTTLGVFTGFALMMAALPALAVYNQEVVLSGGPELASARISFTADDGQPATVTTKQDGDRRIAYIAFDGNSGKAGTLNVATNGTTQPFKLPATSRGESIRINTTNGVVEVVPTPTVAPRPQPQARPSVSLFYGVGSMDVPAIGSASVLSTVDGESFLTETDDNVDLDTYGLQFDFPIGLKGWRAQAFWASYSGDENNRSAAAPTAGGGIDTAIVFQQESPTYGTGLFGGLTPVESYGKVDIDGDKYGASLSWPCARFERVSGTLGLYYQSTDLNQKQFDSFVGVDVNTYREADVSQDSWIVAMGGTYVYPFNEHLAATFSAGALLQFYDANLKSTQQINVFTDPTEILDRHDDDDTVALGGYLGVGLPVTYGRVSFTPSFIVESGLVNAEVYYPQSGDAVLDGKTVELRDNSGTNYAVTVNITIGL